MHISSYKRGLYRVLPLWISYFVMLFLGLSVWAIAYGHNESERRAKKYAEMGLSPESDNYWTWVGGDPERNTATSNVRSFLCTSVILCSIFAVITVVWLYGKRHRDGRHGFQVNLDSDFLGCYFAGLTYVIVSNAVILGSCLVLIQYYYLDMLSSLIQWFMLQTLIYLFFYTFAMCGLVIKKFSRLMMVLYLVSCPCLISRMAFDESVVPVDEWPASCTADLFEMMIDPYVILAVCGVGSIIFAAITYIFYRKRIETEG